VVFDMVLPAIVGYGPDRTLQILLIAFDAVRCSIFNLGAAGVSTGERDGCG
jgi:hypothetical protein